MAERYPSEKLEAAAIVEGYLNGMEAPFDGWHHIDNAHNDLLREIIKQLVSYIHDNRGREFTCPRCGQRHECRSEDMEVPF
jgi:hypothetical protein